MRAVEVIAPSANVLPAQAAARLLRHQISPLKSLCRSPLLTPDGHQQSVGTGDMKIPAEQNVYDLAGIRRPARYLFRPAQAGGSVECSLQQPDAREYPDKRRREGFPCPL